MNAPAPATTNASSLLLTLGALFDAEQNSLFRDCATLGPYLGGIPAASRKALARIAQTSQRHAAELAGAIQDLGGYPAPRGIVREEQFLAYLSAKYLLPRVAQSRQQIIARYEQAIASLAAGPSAPASVKNLLETHLAENRADLQGLASREAAEA